MKLKYAVGILITVLLMMGTWVRSPSLAQSPPGSRLSLVSSDEQEIIVELTVADFQVENVDHAGQRYQRLNVSGMVQTDTPGAPQVPTRGTLLGLPTTGGVSVEILEAGTESLPGFRLYPAPDLKAKGDSLLDGGVEEVFAFDQALYTSDAFYPGRPVTIGYTGLMRDQAIAQVQFYPVQYNPVTGEVRLYRRILARITWDKSSITATDTRPANPDYEKLLQSTLLNYNALKRPAVAPARPGKVTGPEVGAAAGTTPTLKIGVTADGLYELTYSDIISAGFELAGVDPRTLKITNRGVEQPIYVPGEADGVFDPTDTILFYGSAITDIYTTKNIYWLAAGGSSGQRMSLRDGTPHGAPVPVHFPATLHAEEDTFYWQTMPDGAGQDHWFWGVRYTAPTSKTYSLSLSNVSTVATTATIRIRLKGYTGVSTSPDHHTKIFLNDNQIDDQQWDGQIIFDHEVDVPHTYLISGTNTIRVEAVGDTGAVVDQLVTNWIEIDYWHTYVAENNELLFGAPAAGTFQFEVTGFSSNNVQVFDVTNPADVALITNTTVVSDSGSYKLQFEDAAQPQTRYLALAPTQHKSPASIELDQPSAWKSAGNEADYIIITHEDFYTSALTLASHRSATGLRVAVVKVGDIYDEFNDGIFNPGAIRDFLAYAYENWGAPAPTYVLLVGDAVYDYKDNYNFGAVNYVPAPTVETDLLGETPSDNWFVTVSGPDIIPDLFIGRLSAHKISQVDDIVSKIVQYDQNPPDASWNNQALLVADDDSPEFETTSEQLAGLLPAGFTANKVYANDYPPGDPTMDIDNYIYGGSLLVNYTGHGNSDSWGSWSGGRIYDNDNIFALNNIGKLPMVTVANCLNGFFTSPSPSGYPSLAEAFFQLKDKGAVAVWAPTGLGYPSGHQALMTEFYQTVFQDRQYNLGAATTAAKIAIAGQNATWDELVETYVFFGDPATRLGVPPAENPVYLPILIKSTN